MRIVGIVMMRNEADVIEAFARYHLQTFDRLLVADHRSVDSSASIVTRLAEEGLSISLERVDMIEQAQSQVMTRLMRKAAQEEDADWVVPLDADEFLGVDDGGTVRAALEERRDGALLRVPWRTYVPHPADDPGQIDVLQRVRHHLGRERKQFFKIVVPRRVALQPRAALRYGNHSVVDRDTGRRMDPVTDSSDLVLAHFPVRTARQLTTKILLGWLGERVKPDRKPDESLHWKVIYDRVKAGDELAESDLAQLAYRYLAGNESPDDACPELVYRPVVGPSGPTQLRYTRGYECRPLAALAEAAEEIAAELAACRAGAAVSREGGFLGRWLRRARRR